MLHTFRYFTRRGYKFRLGQRYTHSLIPHKKHKLWNFYQCGLLWMFYYKFYNFFSAFAVGLYLSLLRRRLFLYFFLFIYIDISSYICVISFVSVFFDISVTRFAAWFCFRYNYIYFFPLWQTQIQYYSKLF